MAEKCKWLYLSETRSAFRDGQVHSYWNSAVPLSGVKLCASIGLVTFSSVATDSLWSIGLVWETIQKLTRWAVQSQWVGRFVLNARFFENPFFNLFFCGGISRLLFFSSVNVCFSFFCSLPHLWLVPLFSCTISLISFSFSKLRIMSLSQKRNGS